VLFYRYPENFHYAEFLLGGDPEPIDLGEPVNVDSREGAIVLARRLSEHGYETYWLDITTADIAGLGLRVVKVFVPGLQPLYCGMAPTDRARLDKVAHRMGVSRDTLYTVPHPFP
jgi:ribosomal protein S12 methylthiotransferase accessory factor YcaO